MLAALLLPLFLVTGLGCLLTKLRWLGSSWQSGLGELTAKILIPVFLFSGSYRTGLPATVTWTYLAAYFVPLLVLFLASAWAGAPRALAATYSNTVFVGIPVLTQAFGDASLQYAFPVIAFHGLIAFSLFYLASPHDGEGSRVARSIFAAVKNPVVASLLLGLGCNLAGVVLPESVMRFIAMLSGAALPCALLTLGAALAYFRLRRLLGTVLVVSAKLFVLPSLVLGLSLLLGLPPAAIGVLVVIAACPVGVNAAALVQDDAEQATLVSSAILLSSVACMATLPLWVWILRSGAIG